MENEIKRKCIKASSFCDAAVRQLLLMAASRVRLEAQVMTTPLSIQLSPSAPEKAAGGGLDACTPVIHDGEPDEAPGSWL